MKGDCISILIGRRVLRRRVPMTKVVVKLCIRVSYLNCFCVIGYTYNLYVCMYT